MKCLGKGVAMAMISVLIAACAGDRPKNLGVTDGALAACPSSPNCVSSFATDNHHRIAPLVFKDDPEAAFSRLKNALHARSDATIIEEFAGYLRVELRTRLFVDDAEFLLDCRQKVIQVRSASRLGYWDLGKNRSRMEEIRTQFERQNE